ncbi:hypothetical protein VKT23_017775 [Stygiomarasmius scandens]|uniref:Amidohydrolase-related domain-containing protein n=1 Tax=Marasmiellus scandens TaxID=2682957 RepID=A0ABR1IR75_9AGAR
MTPNFLSPLLSSLLFICFGCVIAHSGRPWRDSGWGTIVLEEAWATPDLLEDAAAPPLGHSSSQTTFHNIDFQLGETHAQLNANLLDIHHQRLRRMDENDIDFMVLSCPSPCAQGLADPDAANRLAYSFNNKLAAAIANNTARFGAFAALSMHNATEAALELNRTVKELDFLGAMIFDYQVSGPNADRFLYYDQPEYDPFWRMVTDLDVPVYLHPRVNAEPVLSLLYKHAP